MCVCVAATGGGSCGGGGGGGEGWGGESREFFGNLNNYTPCSPRVINYICRKGILILESSTDRSAGRVRQERERERERERGGGSVCVCVHGPSVCVLNFDVSAC